MITSDWINKVLEKAVPICPQFPRRNGRQNKYSETQMDKGLQQIVPDVPIREEISDNLIGQTDSNFKKIRAWLFQIGEPEEDHYLVLNKCRNDRDAFSYFLKWTRKNEE